MPVGIEGAGIYMIRCRITNKRYVGSSVNVSHRLNDHFQLLRSGKHHSTKLQNAWNKYGPDNFDCDLLDIVFDLGDLRSVEEWYIVVFDSYRNGYNMTPAAAEGSSIPLEVRHKMSEGSKRAGTDPELRRNRSDRAKAQHAAGKLGQKSWKPGTAKIVGSKLKGKPRPGISAFLMGNQYAKKKADVCLFQ